MLDTECEAAFHLALDRISALSAEDPLQGLASVIELMQQINMELLKSYAPVALQAAKNTATAAQHSVCGQPVPGMTPDVTKDHARTVATLGQLEETIVKMGVAAVKTRDEIERQKRSAHETDIGSYDNEEN